MATKNTNFPRHPHPRNAGLVMANKINLRRRQLLIGSVAAGIAGASAASRHDGELGAPPQTINGSVPWKDGTADVPPGATVRIRVLHARRGGVHRSGGGAPDSARSGRAQRDGSERAILSGSPAGRTVRPAAIIIFSAARGRKARPSRAIKAASRPRNFIAPRFPPSRNMSATNTAAKAFKARRGRSGHGR